MKSRVLFLAILLSVAGAFAQTGQAPAAATDPSKTPVSYNPQDAPAAAYQVRGETIVGLPGTTGAVELSAAPTSVSRPTVPEIINPPSAPPTYDWPTIPTNNYGPLTPDANRLLVTPMVNNGPATPLANNPPAAAQGAAPAPPTCDKRCY